MPEEVRSAPGGLDQDHVPVRPGKFENQPWNAWPAADIEEWALRFGNGREEHQGLEHEVSDAVDGVPIGGERSDALPSL